MKPLGNLGAAEQAVLGKAKALLATIRECAANEPETVAEAIGILADIRAGAYEDLNQLQHEYLILRAAAWLVKNGVVIASASWAWNPHQTGDFTEPDLAADSSGSRLVSAEVTASAEPIGTIDSRMATTLEKLSAMPGAKYYFVRSESMRKRAATKVNRAGWPIEVVLMELSGALRASRLGTKGDRNSAG
jgi:hypothetical protein